MKINILTPINVQQQKVRSNSSRVVFIAQNNSTLVSSPVRSLSAFTYELRDDGKIWSDRVSLTASKPIEADMLHMYNPQQPRDEKA